MCVASPLLSVPLSCVVTSPTVIHVKWPFSLAMWMCVIRKALESLAGRDTGDSQRVREQAGRDMDALQHALNKKIADLEQVNVLLVSMSTGLGNRLTLTCYSR